DLSEGPGRDRRSPVRTPNRPPHGRRRRCDHRRPGASRQSDRERARARDARRRIAPAVYALSRGRVRQARQGVAAMSSFVLVHGGAHGAGCWDRLPPLLARDPRVARVLAVDLPGHGRRLEAKPQAEITLDDYVDAVVGDVLGEDLADVVLVGHSLAGIT